MIEFHKVQGVSASPPNQTDICNIVKAMPSAQNPDQFLNLLKIDRSKVIKDLTTLKSNMEQYDAEGYGWQNVINSSSGLEPRPDTWLIGALRIACEVD